MKWNLSVVLICISFMAMDVEHFTCVFWSFGFLPLKKFCLGHFFITSLIWGSIVF
jgi:hypothetical protein